MIDTEGTCELPGSQKPKEEKKYTAYSERRGVVYTALATPLSDSGF